jgi:hypothetical protein
MSSYLSTIHTKSPAHKKRFAFGVSAGFTLVIFAFWSFATFSGQNKVVADSNSLQPVQVAGAAAAFKASNNVNAESPFDTLKTGFSDTMSAIKDGLSQTKTSIDSVDMNSKYQNVRNDALNQTTNGN